MLVEDIDVSPLEDGLIVETTEFSDCIGVNIKNLETYEILYV